MRTERPHLAHSELGKLTQGSVFCCAAASRYDQCRVHGLTITASCDVAQDKHQILNYVPVVDLKDWLRVDGLEILRGNELADFDGKLTRALKHAGVSNSIRKSISIEEIARVHFPRDKGGKGVRKNAERFWDLATDFIDFRQVINNQNSERQWLWFASNRSRKIRELIQRLGRHSVLGYYFLEKLTIDEKPAGHVCLLREVSTLSKRLAEEIGRGLSKHKCAAEFNNISGAQISFECDEFAMPIAQVGSPTIEHIMQAFSSLFGRIGVADPDTETMEHITNTHLTGDAGEES